MSIKTFVTGFPRIGKKRELKFAIESYFKGELAACELEKTAAELRAYGWKKQQSAGINFIPSNDFSFYDNVLDTAFTFGIVPERYKALALNELDTYFAAAHGYQGEKGDVKALPMKKWFNTNYHYIVPEISDNDNFELKAENSAVKAFKEALSLGIKTVPTVIGPYTFLRLATYTGSKKAADFALQAATAYSKLALELANAGAEYISFAEPALVFDVTDDEKELFKSIYEAILSSGAKIKTILTTYFGDIRDVYSEVIKLGFDAINLDFIEGKKTIELLETGFPKDKLLFAGIVCGKNIWRADYSVKNELIAKIQRIVPQENLVIGTSCSLLHVPYTTAEETKLDSDVLKHFSYAEEKLVEIKEIANGDEAALKANKALFESFTVTAARYPDAALELLKYPTSARQRYVELFRDTTDAGLNSIVLTSTGHVGNIERRYRIVEDYFKGKDCL